MDKKKDEIIKLLPLDIRKLFKFCDIEFSKLQEIRLRVNMPIMILYASMEYYIQDMLLRRRYDRVLSLLRAVTG